MGEGRILCQLHTGPPSLYVQLRTVCTDAEGGESSPREAIQRVNHESLYIKVRFSCLVWLSGLAEVCASINRFAAQLFLNAQQLQKGKENNYFG